MTVRWLGTSNGCYSERVSFLETIDDDGTSESSEETYYVPRYSR